MDNPSAAVSNSLLFAGIDSDDIPSMLRCLSAVEKSYKKGTYICRSGDIRVPLSLLIKGEIHLQTEDYWGNRTILAEVAPGDIFSETHALVPEVPLSVDAVAVSECTVLHMDTSRVLQTCSSTCGFHHRLIQNLTGILASKNLMLTEKLEHVSRRTTRDKLLSYLSVRSRQAESSTFEIPFNRQQLADYLAVDRSAMSSELSRLRREGLLDYDRNRFTLY